MGANGPDENKVRRKTQRHSTQRRRRTRSGIGYDPVFNSFYSKKTSEWITMPEVDEDDTTWVGRPPMHVCSGAK